MDPRILAIRSKKIGVCIADTRQKARKSVEDTARYLGITPEQYTAYEKGVTTPSLPQLEMLGLYFNVPVEQLITWQSEPDAVSATDAPVLSKIVKLREHVIAAYLSKARQQKQVSPEVLAEACGISAADLSAYEKAEKSIPYPVLESLSKYLDLDLKSLYSSHGPLKKKKAPAEVEDVRKKIAELTPELYDFVNKPINRPYLELAQKLSEMNVERLRMVAESLLEITY